jgi:hypothetical protein
MPENMIWSPPNAPTQFLAGLMHWHTHIEQFHKVTEQARSSATYVNSAPICRLVKVSDKRS